MQYIKGIDAFREEKRPAVTLGKFDGLHRGHQKLIRRTREFSRQGLKSVVFTLDFNRKGMLLTREERRTILEKQGVDYLVECPFVPEVAHMEPEEFIRGIDQQQKLITVELPEGLLNLDELEEEE